MYSLTFCIRFLSDGPAAPGCRMRPARGFGAPPVARWSPAGDERPATSVAGRRRRWASPSPAGDARRPRPAGRSHYVVISRDGRKLGTKVRVMLP